jgi:hypothetical protein
MKCVAWGIVWVVYANESGHSAPLQRQGRQSPVHANRNGKQPPQRPGFLNPGHITYLPYLTQFHPENGGGILLWIIGINLKDVMVPQSRRPLSKLWVTEQKNLFTPLQTFSARLKGGHIMRNKCVNLDIKAAWHLDVIFEHKSTKQQNTYSNIM